MILEELSTLSLNKQWQIVSQPLRNGIPGRQADTVKCIQWVKEKFQKVKKEKVTRQQNCHGGKFSTTTDSSVNRSGVPEKKTNYHIIIQFLSLPWKTLPACLFLSRQVLNLLRLGLKSVMCVFLPYSRNKHSWAKHRNAAAGKVGRRSRAKGGSSSAKRQLGIAGDQL